MIDFLLSFSLVIPYSFALQSGCNLISIEPYTTLEPFWSVMLVNLLTKIFTCRIIISIHLTDHFGCLQYGLAEDTLRTGGSGNGKDMPPGELYSQSAIYIAAAHSLKPSYSVRILSSVVAKIKVV